MANHGYITSKSNFKSDQVLKDLQEINERRFGGRITIEDSNYGKLGSWFIGYQDHDWDTPRGFNLWISSPKKIEHRHSRDWAFYLEMVFTEELAAKYNATLSDGGHSSKWKAEPEKYPSYKSWVNSRYEKFNVFIVKDIVNMEIDFCPKELRDY